MEELNLKYKHAKKAIDSIKIALDKSKILQQEDIETKKMARESIIKRF